MPNRATVDRLRSLTLGKPVKLKSVEVVLDEGVVLEVREPKVGQRNDILKASGMKPSSDESQSMASLDMTEIMLRAVIELTYDPESGERVFTLADRAALLEQASGGWVDRLIQVSMQMLNVRKEGEPDPAKN